MNKIEIRTDDNELYATLIESSSQDFLKSLAASYINPQLTQMDQ